MCLTTSQGSTGRGARWIASLPLPCRPTGRHLRVPAFHRETRCLRGLPIGPAPSGSWCLVSTLRYALSRRHRDASCVSAPSRCTVCRVAPAPGPRVTEPGSTRLPRARTSMRRRIPLRFRVTSIRKRFRLPPCGKGLNGMRKSKKEAAETRQRIVEAASAAFRRDGIDGTGLADLMAAAA